LRQTLIGLPSTIGFVLQIAHKKQLAKIWLFDTCRDDHKILWGGMGLDMKHS
jgi:hypothetical protein